MIPGSTRGVDDMTSSSIHLDLDDLSLRGGEDFERNYPLELAPVVLGGQTYQVLVPEGVDVLVHRAAGGYLVTVSLNATLYGPCSRCLREVVLKVEGEEQEFVPTSKEGWDEAELSPFIEGHIVDVAGIAREATVLAVPEQVLCAEECRGLCPICGEDLNQRECGCHPPDADERWSALKDIKFED